MRIFEDPKQLQVYLREIRKNKTIGFVPTMGALHEGHLSLMKKAREENDVTVVSIFLNPTQFNNPKDLSTYPENIQRDVSLLEQQSVDVFFKPTFQTIYPDNYRYEIFEKEFSKQLCGAHRPGHFNGVLTVVMKLLQIVPADRAYFGEKDFQQLLLIKGMVESFFIPTEIVPCPIVRDESGLALSSRNQKLSPSGLEIARKFAQTLHSNKSLEEISSLLKDLKVEVEYLEEIQNRRFAAVNIENVRLIDNVSL